MYMINFRLQTLEHQAHRFLFYFMYEFSKFEGQLQVLINKRVKTA